MKEYFLSSSGSSSTNNWNHYTIFDPFFNEFDAYICSQLIPDRA